MPDAAATFSDVEACQVYKQAHNFVYVAGNVNHDADLPIEVVRHILNAWCSLRKITLEVYYRPNAHLDFKIRMLKAVVVEETLYGCVIWCLCLIPPQLLESLHQMAKA